MNERAVPIEPPLSGELLERVLDRLGYNHSPPPTLQLLRSLYAAWCQNVPFDNTRKLIHVRSGNPGPLPGMTATDFLESWLKFGTGGTCWAGAGAFHSLLVALGYNAVRGIGTMLVNPDLPPNHGTVAVDFGPDRYLVDCSMLHGEPLPLREDMESAVVHRAWGIHCTFRDRWHIRWRPLNRQDGFECRLERFSASINDFQNYHQQTRGWSPFNFELNVRLNCGQRVIGIAFGKFIAIQEDGSIVQRAISGEERKRVLIEELKISEELVAQLPEDVATPPPPTSRTAQAAASAE